MYKFIKNQLVKYIHYNGNVAKSLQIRYFFNKVVKLTKINTRNDATNIPGETLGNIHSFRHNTCRKK